MPPPSTILARRISLKSAAVALILAMHGLGLYFLLLPARQLQHYTEVAFMTLIPPRPLPRALPMIVPMPVTAPPRRGRSLPPATITAPATPSEAITIVPEAIVPESAPAAPAGDLRTRAMLAAGGIDKALRAELKQDKPWLAAPQLSAETTFQKMVASAWRGGPVLKLEDYLTPDGRPGTRVVTSNGSACYAMQANPLAGADPFNTAGKVKKVPCP